MIYKSQIYYICETLKSEDVKKMISERSYKFMAFFFLIGKSVSIVPCVNNSTVFSTNFQAIFC